MRLLVIGGAEDKEAGMVILRSLLAMLKKNPLIVVITTASEIPKEVAADYKKAFTKLGAKNIKHLNIETRYEAHDAAAYKLIEKSDCVFFTGGDQLRLTSILGGTPIHHLMLERGKTVIAGTSAGASMMSDNMIIEGKGRHYPSRGVVNLAPGMGLVHNIIIDQHFNKRGRMGRLLTAVAENPHALGLGIDEDTAILINEKKKIKVIGDGVLTVVDGEGISYTSCSNQKIGDAIAMFDVKVHTIPSGYCYDLKTRKPILPAKEKIKNTQHEIIES